MSPEQGIEYALGVSEPAQPEDPEPGERTLDGGSPGDLTPRQREVALLVAQGLTNRQVAAELSLSEHTVATHVRDVLKKLGLQSRTELATWVTERNPLP